MDSKVKILRELLDISNNGDNAEREISRKLNILIEVLVDIRNVLDLKL